MWEKIIEGDQVFWIHEKHGNITQLDKQIYVVMVPIIHKLGPFKTLEEAQKTAENNNIKEKIIEYNNKLVSDNDFLKFK